MYDALRLLLLLCRSPTRKPHPIDTSHDNVVDWLDDHITSMEPDQPRTWHDIVKDEPLIGEHWDAPALDDTDHLSTSDDESKSETERVSEDVENVANQSAYPGTLLPFVCFLIID